MRLLFAGTPAVALPSLTALSTKHDIVAVLTQPARPRGRSAAPVDSPVAEFAKQHDLQLLTPSNALELEQSVRELELDLAVVVAYGQLIPAALLQQPRYGWINLHFSLLPHWRGAAPVQRAIIAGDEVTGASVFQLETGLDTGPVFGQVTAAIGPNETAGELLSRLSQTGAELLQEVVSGIGAGSLVAVPQNSAEATLAPKLSPVDAAVDWRLPALAISRLVRGCTPEPGAWTSIDGTRIRLGPVQLVSTEVELAAGEIEVDKTKVRVGTGSQPVQLGEVKPAGRNWMPAADWARGLRQSARKFD